MGQLEDLVKALEAGGYNAKPGQLHNGQWMEIGECVRCKTQTFIVRDHCLPCAMIVETQKAADQQGPAASGPASEGTTASD